LLVEHHDLPGPGVVAGAWWDQQAGERADDQQRCLWVPVSVTSCDLRVLMDQPTESISPRDPPSRHDHS